MHHFQASDLFVFDLDGTALGGYEPYERLPDAFCAVLDEFHAMGGHWCTNTTWHPDKQCEMLAASAVRSSPAFLYGRTGLMRAVPGGSAGELVFDHDWLQRCEEQATGFRTRVLPAFRKRWEARLPEWHAELKQYADEPLMLVVDAVPESWPQLAAEIGHFAAHEPEVCVQIDDEQHRLVLMPAHMSKGAAVRTMQQDLGVPPDRTLVAGDGCNDLDMFDRDLARYQVCPANACAAVQECVRQNNGCVGTMPFSDGVLEALGTLFGRGD